MESPSTSTALFTTSCRVEFADTDMAGIAHFTNFLHYMERAEHAFLRSRGLNVVLTDERGSYGFPKRHIACDYWKPAVHGAHLDLTVHADWGDGKSIRYVMEVRQGGELLASGVLHVACCRFPLAGLPYPIPLPDFVVHHLATPPLPAAE